MTHQQDWRFEAKALVGVPCPLCAGRGFRVLASSDRYDMALQTVGCESCGLVMTNPQPDAAALDQFYRERYRLVYQRVETPSLDYIRKLEKDVRAAETAQFLAQQGVLREGLVVLDIGASEGCILKAIRDRVPGVRAIAVEPNPTFGAFAVDHAGCELHADIGVLPAELEGRVGLVIFNHVLEHIGDPLAFLRGLRRWLTADARLYIDVPDVERYTGLEALHVAHLYHFCARTLRATVDAGGFGVSVLEAHEPRQQPASLRCLATLGAATGAAPGQGQEGWPQLQRIERRAHGFHRQRWSQVQIGLHRLHSGWRRLWPARFTV